MKISKKAAVVLLALVLAIVSFVPSTFSWYLHNGSLTGGSMKYDRSELPVSIGTISLSTQKYQMDPRYADHNKIYYDEKGNKHYEENGTVSSGDTVSFNAAGNYSQYYGTKITNSGSEAYVNLYLQGLTNSTDVYVGTIAPSLTHKGLSSSVHLANSSMVRVYVQWAEAKGWKAENAKHYLVYKRSDNKEVAVQIDSNSIAVTDGNTALINGTVTYYGDLPAGVKEFYFATDANASKFSPGSLTPSYVAPSVTQKWYRTKTISDIHAETCYYLTGSVDDTTWNAQYSTFNIVGGVSVISSFDKVTMNAGQNAYITLTAGTNFTGASVRYVPLAAGSALVVNENTGYVTAKSGFAPGSDDVTITTEITGVLGDTTTVETVVSNPLKVSSVPIAMNVRVPGRSVAKDDEGNVILDSEDHPVYVNGEVEIVWYIRNEGSSNCSFDSIYYTK